MADVKISALPAAATLTGTEELPVVQSATTTRTTVNAISALAPVQSVAGKTGTVTLTPSDAGAEPADATILKSAAIGVTLQGYSAILAGTTASFTTADETKLDGIAAGAEVNVNADWNAVSGDAEILNKPTLYSDASVDTHLNTGTAGTGEILSWNGTDYDWITAGSGSVTSVTGTSPVASSGGITPAISLASGYGDTQNPYASKTANFVLAAPNGTAGVPTFRAVVAADVPTLNQNTTGTASNVTGVVAVANGGTGLSATPTNGQLNIGNGTGFTLATLTAGSGVSITNGSGAITIASTSSGGSVTSVSVVSANGFAGTVATATTTPAITLTTSLTGLLKGNGTAMSAAVSGTDYLAPPSGTALLKANSGGALANAVSGTDYVTPTGSETLTNKTLTSPVIGTIVNTGTLTLPTSTDTLIGRATTDTLTNKTLASPTVTGTATFASVSPSTTAADSVGYVGLPQNSQSAAYTLVAADVGKSVVHPITDNNARTFTIPANGTVAYPVGTAITFVNMINTVTIAITTDTMYLAGAGTTGSRTLAAYGVATAIKMTSTSWIISGNGLT